MRIQHNISALNAHRQLTVNNNSLGKNLEKLSSGYRINRAGDDAAGLAISEKMRSTITGLDTAQKNAQDGVSMVQTAEGYLQEVHSMLNRMTELATQASNGIYVTTDRAKMADEMDQLKAEINRIGSVAKFNDTNLFVAADKTMTLQIGETGVADNQLIVTLNSLSTTDLAIADISLGTVAAANSAITAVYAAIDTISTRRGALGAAQNRLEHTINSLGTASENLNAAESRIRDVDMAKEMMTYTKNNILVQASQSMLAQANQAPQGVLQLLQ